MRGVCVVVIALCGLSSGSPHGYHHGNLKSGGGSPASIDGFAVGGAGARSFSSSGSFSESSASSYSASKSGSFNYNGAGSAPNSGLGFLGGAGSGALAGSAAGAGAASGASGTGFGARNGAGFGAGQGTEFGAGNGAGFEAGNGAEIGAGSAGLSHATVPAYGDHITPLASGSSKSGSQVNSYGGSIGFSGSTTGNSGNYGSEGIRGSIEHSGNDQSQQPDRYTGSSETGSSKYNSQGTTGFGGSASGANAGAYGGASSYNGGVSGSGFQTGGLGIGITGEAGKYSSTSGTGSDKYSSQGVTGYGGSTSGSGAQSGSFGASLDTYHIGGVSGSGFPSVGQPGKYSGSSGTGSGFGISGSGGQTDSYGAAIGTTHNGESSSHEIGFESGVSGQNVNSYGGVSTTRQPSKHDAPTSASGYNKQGSNGFAAISSDANAQSGAYGGSNSGGVIGFEIGLTGQKGNNYYGSGSTTTTHSAGNYHVDQGKDTGTFGPAPTSDYASSSQPSGGQAIGFEIGVTGQKGNNYYGSGSTTTTHSAGNYHVDQGKDTGTFGPAPTSDYASSSQPSGGQAIGFEFGVTGQKGNNNYGSGSTSQGNAGYGASSGSLSNSQSGAYSGSLGSSGGLVSSKPSSSVIGIDVGITGSNNYGVAPSNTHTTSGVSSNSGITGYGGTITSHTPSSGQPGKYTGGFGGAPGILGNQVNEGYAVSKKGDTQTTYGTTTFYDVSSSSNDVASNSPGITGGIGFGVSGSGADANNKYNGQNSGNNGGHIDGNHGQQGQIMKVIISTNKNDGSFSGDLSSSGASSQAQAGSYGSQSTGQYGSGTIGFGVGTTTGGGDNNEKDTGKYTGSFGGSTGILGHQQTVGYGIKGGHNGVSETPTTIVVTTGVMGGHGHGHDHGYGHELNKNKYGHYEGDFGGAPGILVATGPAPNHPGNGGYVGTGVVVGTTVLSGSTYGAGGSHSHLIGGSLQAGNGGGCKACDASLSGNGAYNQGGSASGAYAGAAASSQAGSGGYGGVGIHGHGSHTPLGLLNGVIGGVLGGIKGAAGVGAGASAGSHAESSSNSASLGLGGLFSAGISSSHASSGASSSAGAYSG